MIYSVNILEFNYHNDQTSGTVRDYNYKVKFLFTMSDFCHLEQIIDHFLYLKYIHNGGYLWNLYAEI